AVAASVVAAEAATVTAVTVTVTVEAAAVVTALEGAAAPVRAVTVEGPAGAVVAAEAATVTAVTVAVAVETAAVVTTLEGTAATVSPVSAVVAAEAATVAPVTVTVAVEATAVVPTLEGTATTVAPVAAVVAAEAATVAAPVVTALAPLVRGGRLGALGALGALDVACGRLLRQDHLGLGRQLGGGLGDRGLRVLAPLPRGPREQPVGLLAEFRRPPLGPLQLLGELGDLALGLLRRVAGGLRLHLGHGPGAGDLGDLRVEGGAALDDVARGVDARVLHQPEDLAPLVRQGEGDDGAGAAGTRGAAGTVQ